MEKLSRIRARKHILDRFNEEGLTYKESIDFIKRCLRVLYPFARKDNIEKLSPKELYCLLEGIRNLLTDELNGKEKTIFHNPEKDVVDCQPPLNELIYYYMNED